MATSNFQRYFATAAGVAITTGTIELLPYGNLYPAGVLAMTHLGDGVWGRGACPDGEYDLYINGVVSTKYTRFWIGDNRVSTIADHFDSADSYKLKTTGLKDQMATVTSLTVPTPDYLGQMGRDASGNNYIAIALTGTMWEIVSGDMTKSTYDTNANGIVDNSEKVIGKIPTVTPTANAIPIADTSGTLNGWVTNHFRGVFASLAALNGTTFVNLIGGDYADVDSVGVDVVRYVYDVTDAKWVQIGSAGSGATSIVDITYAAAQTAITGATLIAGQLYKITDRNIILVAISTNQFSTKGVYLYSGGKKARTSLHLTVSAGLSGTVTTLTVNSIAIATLPISIPATTNIFSHNSNVAAKVTVSDENTNYTGVQLIVNAINAYGLYDAYSVGTLIGIVCKTTGVRTDAVNMSGTNLTTIAGALSLGAADTTKPVVYHCGYDFTTDMLLELYDPLFNNALRQSKVFQGVNGNTLLDFDWNNAAVYNNVIEDSIVEPNFIYGTGIYADNQVRNSRFGANHISSSSMQGNILINAEMTGNYMSAGTMSFNKLVGGGGGALYPDLTAQMNNNTINTSGNVENNELVSGAWFNYNEVISNGTFHSNNMYFYSEFSFNYLYGNNARLFDNIIRGRQFIRGNQFNNALFYDTDIKDDALMAYNIFNNCLFGDGVSLNCTFVNNTFTNLIFVTSNISNQWFDGINYNRVGTYGNNQVYSGGSGLMWDVLASINMNGSTGGGIIGDVIPIYQLRNNTYVYELRITNNACVAAAGTQIKIGFTGSDAAILPLTDLNTLLANVDNLFTTVSAKTTADNTNMILTVTAGAITSGHLVVAAKLIFAV